MKRATRKRSTRKRSTRKRSTRKRSTRKRSKIENFKKSKKLNNIMDSKIKFRELFK